MTEENDMTGRIGDEEKMERVWGGERVYTVKQKVLFLTAFEDISADCALETNFLHVYPLLSISEFHPQKELPSSHYLLAAHSISPLPFGLSPIRVCRGSHARDTQDLTRLFPHKALHCLFGVLMRL